MRRLAWLLLLGALAHPACRTPTNSSPLPVYHVDKGSPACVDVSGAGTVERPFCTFAFVTRIARPGDTFLIHAGRYGEGPLELRRDGTAAAPITYRAIGDVVIGLFTDVVDEDFAPSQWPVASFPDIYSILLATAALPSRVSQTYFDPIAIDDPANPSNFTMVDADGPLTLNRVTDYPTLTAHDGTWLYDAGRLHVHAYGNRRPSRTGTDFVVVYGSAIVVRADFNVFEGFRAPYGSATAFTVLGSDNTFRNLTLQASGILLYGSRNTLEHYAISHVFARGDDWTWHLRGSGSAMGVRGPGHVLRDGHVFHNWNSSLSAEGSTGLVVDGLRMHGAPNHCGAYGPTSTIRNAIFYNCQDYFYWDQTTGIVADHTVNPYGIAAQGRTIPAGPFVVRNSILSGTIGYTTLSVQSLCQYEEHSILENNVIHSAATIERCVDGKQIPIKTYMAQCASGALTGCMTLRNNIMVDDWDTVLANGMWERQSDVWDATLATGSPAIGAATDGSDIGLIDPHPYATDRH